MKICVFLLLLVFSLKNSLAQPSEPKPLGLSVEKQITYKNVTDTVILKMKPERFLKLITYEGKKLRSAQYELYDSTIVMYTLSQYGNILSADTVLIQDIVKIRGNVYGNAERKVGGAIFALGGVPLASMGYILATLSSTPLGAVFMMLPGIGLSFSGIRMMGARSFNTSHRWKLKTTPSTNPQTDENEKVVTGI